MPDEEGYPRIMFAAPQMIKDVNGKSWYYDKWIAVYINGRPIGKFFNLSELPVNKIDYINFYLNSGPGGTKNGILEIVMTTDENWDNYRNNVPGISAFQKQGYSLARSFYAPKYGVMGEYQKGYLRNTVFWAPHVAPDGNGKLNFSYFNADETGKYRMVVEGMDLKGNLARKVLTYILK